MLGYLRRLFRETTVRAGFDAGGGGRRWKNASTITNVNASVLADGRIISQRAAYLTRNNPWIAKGVNALVSNLVGAGIKPRSNHPDAGVRKALHDLWRRWTDEADAAGLTDLYGQQGQVTRSMVEGGEAFVRMRQRRDADGLTIPLQLEIIDREQVPVDLMREDRERRVRAGIEFDALGRRVGYHVYRHRPTDPFLAITGQSLETVRVDGRDMAHVFNPTAPGQLRGVSWLASVMLRLQELDRYEDATLKRAQVAALFAGFLRDGGGAPAALSSATNNGVSEPSLEPGVILPMPAGSEIEFTAPPENKDYEVFTRMQLRAIAAGLGLTYEQLTGDLSDVNYSSIRAGLIEFRRFAEYVQFSVLVYQLCRPIWRRFVATAVLSGALPAHDFETDPRPYLDVEWLPPRFDWVDPAKDIGAEISAVSAGFKTRSQVIAERGYDAEAIDAELAADAARAAALGLTLTTHTGGTTAAAQEGGAIA